MAKTIRLLLATLLLSAGLAGAAEVKVMTSGGFAEAHNVLTPQYEKRTGDKVVTMYGSSMGGAPDSIPSRLARGEPADIVILAAPALEELIKQGKVVPGSRVDLVRSTIGMSVRAGAPKPDISTVEALKRTLREAKSIAYSASASGVYLSTDLFPRLGIWDEIKGKSKRIESARVATIVANGEAEIGFQQVSELLPIPGADFVGPLPAEVQQVTIFSAGLATGSKEPEAARALIQYFTSPEAAPVIAKTGLEPIGRSDKK
jgi:molybdate transport system substrate-binding protein